MFGWWRKDGPESLSGEPRTASVGMLNSTLPLRSSTEVHPSSAEFTRLQLKNQTKRNQRSAILGTTEVAMEHTAATASDCASEKESMEEAISRLLELNWNWVLPKPLPTTQSFDQDVIRIWSAHAPPARRQPTAQEHAVELLQLLQRQPRLVGKWILATDLKHEVYPNLLDCLGWAPRPWVGRNGVAKHLGDLTLRPYKRVEVAGTTHNWAAFFVPGARTFAIK